MLDPVVVSALVVLAAYGLKALASHFGFPIDDTTLNTIAAAIVGYLLSLFGLGLIHRGFKGAVDKGLLGDMKVKK